ncbi:MAG TPA: glucose 1-dehydrogenase [Alphaproteobacteria bacterium]|nr:glucose 1-dehydrogenase [Alphaproteobacteria bacterium]
MPGLLEGHIALITGGGSGIGRGIALAYAREGATVIAADISTAGAEETVGMIGGNSARAETLDVTDRAACDAAAAKVKAEVGNVSILVNNAGIVRRAALDVAENPLADWDDTIGINVNGVFNTTYAFLEQLKATKGRIISIGSIQSFLHTPNCVAYTTSKHAVKGFTVGLAAELGPHGIRVNAIGPGVIRTPINEQGIMQNPERLAAVVNHIPMGRYGTPEDISGPAVFLASDLAQYVTGHTLVADGGYLTV